MLRKLIGLSLVALLLGAAGSLTYLYLKKPDMRESTIITVDRSPDRVLRGQYLFAMAGCEDCHSEVATDKFGFPVKQGRLAVGKGF